MLPTVELVLGTIKAVAEAWTETLRFAQTDTGKQYAADMLRDKVKRDQWMDAAGKKIGDFFAGKFLELTKE